ncbi:hypothetical protein Dimus_032721 [Dionaea muscipula]
MTTDRQRVRCVYSIQLARLWIVSRFRCRIVKFPYLRRFDYGRGERRARELSSKQVDGRGRRGRGSTVAPAHVVASADRAEIEVCRWSSRRDGRFWRTGTTMVEFRWRQMAQWRMSQWSDDRWSADGRGHEGEFSEEREEQRRPPATRVRTGLDSDRWLLGGERVGRWYSARRAMFSWLGLSWVMWLIDWPRGRAS